MNPAQLPTFRLGVEPPNKDKKYPPVPLTRDEYDALMRACGKGVTGRRNRALIATCVYTGIRDIEMRRLEVHDLDLADGILRVREGKRRKDRPLGMNAELVAILHDWLALRAELIGRPRSGPVFCTLTRGSEGRPLSESAMRNSLPKIGRRAGIEKRVHMHGLRHTFADWQIRSGTRLEVLQDMLGHDEINTTIRYAKHLRPDEVLKRMRLDLHAGKAVPEQDVAQKLADLSAQIAALQASLPIAA